MVDVNKNDSRRGNAAIINCGAVYAEPLVTNNQSRHHRLWVVGDMSADMTDTPSLLPIPYLHLCNNIPSLLLVLGCGTVYHQTLSHVTQ